MARGGHRAFHGIVNHDSRAHFQLKRPPRTDSPKGKEKSIGAFYIFAHCYVYTSFKTRSLRASLNFYHATSAKKEKEQREKKRRNNKFSKGSLISQIKLIPFDLDPNSIYYYELNLNRLMWILMRIDFIVNFSFSRFQLRTKSAMLI